MSEQELFMHYVSTYAEAAVLIAGRNRFWVCNCGCRESGPGCRQSRTDVCLMFSCETGSSGSNPHEISKAEAEDILQHAKEKRLVCRPFRNQDFSGTDGICFCCQDCCGYFKSEEEACNKGKYIEHTDMEICVNCGACMSVCYFRARMKPFAELEIDRDKCFGCGLCVTVCPMDCVRMVER